MKFELRTNSLGFIAIVILMNGLLQPASAQNHGPMVTEKDFHRAMDELSNWGRWGDDDELGRCLRTVISSSWVGLTGTQSCSTRIRISVCGMPLRAL